MKEQRAKPDETGWAQPNNPNSLYKQTRALMEQYGFAVKKNFGQNFLIDDHVLGKIIQAADLGPEDLVLEIGPGLGTLTAALAKQAGRVVAIEIDETLIPILAQTLGGYPNVTIVQGDILKTDLVPFIGDTPREHVKLVANLPYYITTPIVMGVLEGGLPIGQMVVMMQKEVASRLTATAGTKAYGALSLICAYFATCTLAANVPPNCFIPRPTVDSAVVSIHTYSTPPQKANNQQQLFALMKAAFAMRRKTLVNCLFQWEGAGGRTKEELAAVLLANGFSPDVRGEVLTLADYVQLANALG